MPDSSSQDEAAISRRATEWFALLLDPGARPEDYAAFDAWLSEDERHSAAYARVEHLWRSAGLAPDLGKSAAVTRRAVLKGGGAAVLAAASAGAAWHIARRADYVTAAGERSTVTLPDGSRMELSTSSAASLDFSASGRRVLLQRGEAFFDVTKEERPFLVRAGQVEARALGTAFAVSHEGTGVRVSVVESRVEVSSAVQRFEAAAGEGVMYTRNDLVRYTDDMDMRLSWRQGRLVFISQPFGEVIHTLGKWRRGHMRVMDEALALQPVTLIVDVRRAEMIPEILAGSLPVRVQNYTPWLTLFYPA